MLTRTLLAVLAAAVFAVTVPAVGSAADPHGTATAAEKAVTGGAHKEGSPSVFDLPARWDLSIYTLIVFGILFVLLSRFAWPAIMKGMQAREQGILDARDQAQAAQREAESIRAELQGRLAKAHDDVKAMLEEARKDAEKLRATERELGVQEAAAERERAKREIDAAKETALQEIYQRSVTLASLMSSKAIRRELSPADHSRLVDESLAELAAKPSVN